MLELVAVVTTYIDFYSLRSSILANKLKNSQSFGALTIRSRHVISAI